jgi:beta-glucosidase
VTNTGRVPGKDALLLFVTDETRRITPEVKLLKRFAKSPLLAPGESWTYEAVLRPLEDLSYWCVSSVGDPSV